MTQHPLLRNRPLLAVAGSLALTASVLAASPLTAAQASTTSGTSSPRISAKVVARGLNSPRLLSFAADGSLYVAEAGKGGKGPCVMGGDGSKACFGLTGSITRIRNGHQHRVVKKLPSLAGGGEAIGPEDVMVMKKHYTISMGAGIDAASRATIGSAARSLGTLVSGRLGRAPHVIADVAAYEYANNPDHSEARDSDPAGFISRGRGNVLADAGGNTLLRADRWGQLHKIAVFPTRMVSLPPAMGGGMVPMQAVPTAVAVGPDGAYYVSQLTGFPFPTGAARIFRVVPGHAPKVWASGLTNVTDLAWSGHKLYAVQISNIGLLGEKGLPVGSLIRVHRGVNHKLHTVAGNLPAPYGVAISGKSAYVTTCSVCTGGGKVMRFRLH